MGRYRILTKLILGATALVLSGCTEGVEGAARRGLAGFINEVFTSAVNEALVQQ